MLPFVVRRLLVSVPSMLGILFITFFLMHLVPGNPLERALEEQGGTPQARARLMREYRLDRPWYARFAGYCAGLARGDLGSTMVGGLPIAPEIASRLPNTFLLALVSIFLASVLGVTTGTIAAARPGSFVDHGCRAVAVFGLSTPVFWFGLMLMYLFALELRWLPATSDTPSLALNLILPSIALCLRPRHSSSG